MNLAGECRASSPDPHWEQIFFPALTWTEGSPQCCSRNRYCDPERTHDGKAEEESKKRAIKSRRFRYQNISIRSVSRPMRVMHGGVSQHPKIGYERAPAAWPRGVSPPHDSFLRTRRSTHALPSNRPALIARRIVATSQIQAS